jgi:hypothetical protein
MASTQVARAAAQLHEAAQDVARVAALRSAQPQEPTTDPQVPQQLGLTKDEDGGDGPVTGGTIAGDMARVLAARLAERDYHVLFPPGRDPSAFKVTGLPGGPDVEVTAEDDGSAACHYTGRSTAEAAEIIARLPVPGHPEIEAASADTVIATWDGIEVEWHYRPLESQSADADRVTAALLAHLDILGVVPEARPLPAPRREGEPCTTVPIPRTRLPASRCGRCSTSARCRPRRAAPAPGRR